MRAVFGILLCLVVSTGVVSARDLVPTPVGGGEGVTTCPEHLALPGDGRPLTTDRPVRPADRSAAGDKAGGITRIVDSRSVLLHCSVDVASDGTIYAAGADQGPDGWSIRIHRSQDGGHTWELWGEITDAIYGNNYMNPCLKVGEGDVDKCYVVYERGYAGSSDQSIRMNSAFLDAPTGDFSATESVISQTGLQFSNPRLFIDDGAFSDFYLYVVAEGDDGATGEDIWFARSTDQGETFETEYEIATTTADNRGYLRPDIAYGYGRYVHVTWYYASHVGAFNDCICYRRAPNDAGGGVGSWETIRTLTSPVNGYEEYFPRLAASLSDGRLVIAHDRSEDMGAYELGLDCGVLHSDDQGVSFDSEIMYQSLSYVSEAAHDPTGARWVFAGMEGNHSPGLQTAPHADPTDWSEVDVFATEETLVFEVGMAVDAGRGGHAAAVWTAYDATPGATDFLVFDAEWRADPGYPVPLDGFPVALEDVPSGAPAVADLDGDGDLEIVFAVGDGYFDSYLHALDHDGGELPGWPVELGFRPTEGAPVAVGPVGPDGETYVIVGRHDGGVRAYDASGAQVWSYGIMSDPTYVSIGALGTPNPYSVAAVSGHSLTFLGPDGEPTPGTISWYFSGSADALAPAAIGDVDGDEIAEAVFALGTSVYAQEMNSVGTTFIGTLPHEASAGVTLWDFDGDGDQETVVPTADGFVYLLNHDGLVYPAWTIDTHVIHPVSEVAVADVLDYIGLELSFTAGDTGLHLYRYTGSSALFFPVYTGLDLSSGPVVGLVSGGIDLVVGSLDANMLVVTSDPDVPPGWPQGVDDPIRHSPAMGDLDQDGSVELVWLTDSSCYAVDIGQPPAAAEKTWPMSRHDAKRTGCADCVENVATSVEDPAPGLARVSFRAPHPNPVSSSTVFAFALPVRAIAELEIVDPRGRRVRLVGREELPPASM